MIMYGTWMIRQVSRQQMIQTAPLKQGWCCLFRWIASLKQNITDLATLQAVTRCTYASWVKFLFTAFPIRIRGWGLRLFSVWDIAMQWVSWVNCDGRLVMITGESLELALIPKRTGLYQLRLFLSGAVCILSQIAAPMDVFLVTSAFSAFAFMLPSPLLCRFYLLKFHLPKMVEKCIMSNSDPTNKVHHVLRYMCHGTMQTCKVKLARAPSWIFMKLCMHEELRKRCFSLSWVIVIRGYTVS